MKTINSAVIGCGAIAREHILAVEKVHGARLTAVCDLSRTRAEATAERFRIEKWYCDYHEMLKQERPTLVHITVPPLAHFLIAKHCLERGIHVLCEKPIVPKIEEFTSLKHLAIENGCVLLENQNLRFHSSVLRMKQLEAAGAFGEILEVQVRLFLNLYGSGSPYVDRNVPHFATELPGGVIGDFLPHLAYLALMFTGAVVNLRCSWNKRRGDSPLIADEFRALLVGQRATGVLAFSGNAQPNGFWVKLVGTKLQAEANLFDPPRITFRKIRSGEPAIMSLIDGIAESRDVFRGSVAALWRKLAGRSSYDGLPQFVAAVYDSIQRAGSPPLSLAEIEESVRLVASFSDSAALI